MIEFSEDDHRFMQRALVLAERARYIAPPNPAVGCVLIQGDNIIGEGWTQRVGGSHAEIKALENAAGQELAGATAYVTLEPCCHTGRTGPCTDALIEAGVARVVVAMPDPDPRVDGSGLQQLSAAGIAVSSGLLSSEARVINKGFFHRLEHGRPRVTVKIASSLDGRTAMESGESVWITGEAARRDVQFMRARSDCILTGSGTVLHDDPTLDVRLSAEDLQQSGPVRQPLRVLLDSTLRTPLDARLFATGGDIRIYSNGINNNKYNGLNKPVKVISDYGVADRGVDLEALFADLARIPVNEVHVEAGATLCGALLSRRLVDEIVLYLAPHLMGNQGRAQFILPGLATMSDRIELQQLELDKVGEDIRIRCRPCYPDHP